MGRPGRGRYILVSSRGGENEMSQISNWAMFAIGVSGLLLLEMFLLRS
jgi:hypothetical protein